METKSHLASDQNTFDFVPFTKDGKNGAGHRQHAAYGGVLFQPRLMQSTGSNLHNLTTSSAPKLLLHQPLGQSFKQKIPVSQQQSSSQLVDMMQIKGDRITSPTPKQPKQASQSVSSDAYQMKSPVEQ